MEFQYEVTQKSYAAHWKHFQSLPDHEQEAWCPDDHVINVLILLEYELSSRADRV